MSAEMAKCATREKGKCSRTSKVVQFSDPIMEYLLAAPHLCILWQPEWGTAHVRLTTYSYIRVTRSPFNAADRPAHQNWLNPTKTTVIDQVFSFG